MFLIKFKNHFGLIVLIILILSNISLAQHHGESQRCISARNSYRSCEQLFYLRGASNIESYCRTRIAEVRSACANSNRPTLTERLRNTGDRIVERVVRTLGTGVSQCQRMPNCAGSSHIEVDINSNCMCVGATCFRVSVGRNPSWNPTGTGVVQSIDRPDGVGRYQTNSQTRTDRYDDDAVAMSLPGVWSTGKWIHKSGNCTSHWRTRGCIAVPCAMWDLVKESIGQSITVCRGGGGPRPRTEAPSQRLDLGTGSAQ